MALPVSPAPKSDDVAVHGWAGLTVRVAWTLLTAGVRVRPEVLDAARRHALYHIPPSTELPKAEDRAGHLVRRFVAQARGRPYADAWPSDAEMVLTDRWARSFAGLRDRTAHVVFRLHYGDEKSLAQVEQKLGVDRIAVEAARGGLREVLRGVARVDGVPLDTWPAERLDRVLNRLAAWSPDACPPTWDVVNGAHRAHLQACARCSRMLRLVTAGILDHSDLTPPTLKARPRESTAVLALHFHPDGRAHRASLAAALPTGAHAIGDDLLLVDARQPALVRETLALAAEVALPARQHLRGAVLEGAGEWTRFGPVGPLATAAAAEVRTRGWGVVDGIGALPDALPAPPDAWNAWGAVAGLAATAGLAIWLAQLASPGPSPGIDVDFTSTARGTWTRFDVPEARRVHLVGLEDGHPRAVLVSDTAADKASLAIGDGTYRALVPGAEVLLVAAAGPLPMAELIAEASRSTDAPLSALAREILRREPGAAVFQHGR
jgi:hypothetical protein